MWVFAGNYAKQSLKVAGLVVVVVVVLKTNPRKTVRRKQVRAL